MNAQKDLLMKVYQDFNRRNIPAVLSAMQPDVEWPNGWEGGYVYGHDELAQYWARQWKELDPKVEPINYTMLDDGRLELKVHQVVMDLKGAVLFDGLVTHVYTFKNGLVKRMEIIK
jgi:SnoaL-like protein